MATGTGLDAQLMLAEESTPGTAVTPTLALEFDSESLVNEPVWTESSSLRAGGRYVARTSRRRKTGDRISGSVTLECVTKGMSLLFRHAVGSSVAALTTGTQAHAFGGNYAGRALTVQVGRPLPVSPYTVSPFTYAGCKVTAWEFTVSNDGQPARITLELDGISVTTATALASASYVASSVPYVFSDVTTATLAGTSLVSGGLVMRSITIRGEFPLDTERQGLGFGVAKAEQLLIGPPTISVSMEGEFNKTALYDPFVAETAQAFVLAFTSGSSSLTFNIPSTKIRSAAPAVSGPEIVANTVELEGLDDETNAPITVTVVN